MRAISPYPRYSLQIFEGQESIVVDQRGAAMQVVVKKPHVANFQQGGILPWEYEAALSRFSFSGVPEGVNPLSRIAHFDTEAYAAQNNVSDEELAAMDERLRTLSELFPSEFMLVEKPAAAKPWESYDEDEVTDILELQARLKRPPELVRLYEYEHQNREEIITAMEEAEADLRGEETITVNA